MPGSFVRVHPVPDAAATDDSNPLPIESPDSDFEKAGAGSAADSSLFAGRHLSASQSSVLGPLWALLFKRYSGVVDLYDLRARDGAAGIFSALMLAFDVAFFLLSKEDSRPSDDTTLRALFWTSVALKALSVLDYLLRCVQPAFSVMDGMTRALRRCFPCTPYPFPMAAALPRYLVYLTTLVGNLLLRLLAPESFGVLLLQSFILMCFVSSACFHMCFVYAIFFAMMGGDKHRRGKPVTRFGALVPDQLQHVQFTALGPAWKDEATDAHTIPACPDQPAKP